MGKRTALLLAEALLLLLLWRLCCPERQAALRAWAGETLLPGGRETVEAWGRALSGEEEPVPALRPEAAP